MTDLMHNNSIHNNSMKGRVDEVVVRVGTVEEPSAFGEGKFLFFKFIVENEKALRIQCIVMEDQIERVKPLVKKNTIIRIKGATSKRETNPRYNFGDVPFVFMIYSDTEITVIRDCNSDDDGEEEQTYGFGNERPASSLSEIVSRVELHHIAEVINENTTAMKKLTAALRETRRKF